MNKIEKEKIETLKEKYLILLRQRENRVVRFNLIASFYYHMKGESQQQKNVIKKKSKKWKTLESCGLGIFKQSKWETN